MNLLDEIRSIPSSKKDLRKFGLTLGIFFAILAGLFFWRSRPVWPVFTALSGFFLFFALILPGALKWIQKAWMTLAFLMGWVMTRVVLTILFCFVVTPIAFLMRWTGKDPLKLRSKPDQASYWVERPAITDKTHYERQY